MSLHKKRAAYPGIIVVDGDRNGDGDSGSEGVMEAIQDKEGIVKYCLHNHLR